MNNTSMQEQSKIKITERALCQRINRKLKPDFMQLRAARGWRSEETYGHYYILDLCRNQVTEGNVDLVATGREIGVLREWEEVAG